MTDDIEKAKEMFKAKNLPKTLVTGAIGFGLAAVTSGGSAGINLAGRAFEKIEDNKAVEIFEHSRQKIGEDAFKLKELYKESGGSISHADKLKDIGNGVREVSGFGAKDENNRAVSFVGNLVDKGLTQQQASEYLSTSEKYIKANGTRDASGHVAKDQEGNRETPYLKYDDYAKIRDTNNAPEFNAMLEKAAHAKDKNPQLAKTEMVTAKDFIEFTQNRAAGAKELGMPAGQKMTDEAHASLNKGKPLEQFNKETDKAKERKAEFGPEQPAVKPAEKKHASNNAEASPAAQLAQSDKVKAASANIQQTHTPPQQMPTQNVPAPTIAGATPPQTRGPVV